MEEEAQLKGLLCEYNRTEVWGERLEHGIAGLGSKTGGAAD